MNAFTSMKVCRTCLQVLNNEANCLLVNTDDLSMDSPSIRSKLMICVPELAVDVVQCAVICASCSDALNTAYDFKNKCLQTEERILNYAQYTGCNTDSVNISDVAQFTSQTADGDAIESRQHLNDIHYPITQIIEQDSDVDIKPVIPSCDTHNDDSESFTYETEIRTVNIKVEADEPDSAIVNNGIENPLPNPVLFSPELDVEVRGYRPANIDFYSQGVHFSQGGQFSQINEQPIAQNNFCMYCQKSFLLMSELEVHLMTHMENRPLKCQMCDRRFVRKDKLQLHMRIHTGEKPFECTLCGRCFSRKDKLNNHMRTHTGEKPHQCILCQKSFARKDKMNTHMRSQHWLALANLEITVVKNAGLTSTAEPPVSENANSQ